ncbi:hypothetical protein ACFVTX_03030 [Agromyces sp. NPDC058136]|uniref:hypothetical protein n=1 Tax=Agromyces sp. NPDC058136 TaxID=3346354 RepID=UPI0036DB0430
MDVNEMLREALERLAEAEAELDAEIEAERAQNDEAREQLAARARKGELGADWQRVQQRIDLGETSLEAVFTGGDDSQAARALRDRSQQQMQDLADEWREADEQGDGEEPSPAAVVSHASAESAAAHDAAAARIAEALRSIRRTAHDDNA